MKFAPLVYALAFAVGLAIGSLLPFMAHAQIEVTASVECNDYNRHYSTYCMDWDGQNVSGQIYGTEFYTIWINPELMLFWTPDAYWYVTPTGIEL